MVMWQILSGRALKAWNNQLLRPARGRVVHVFLSKKEKRKISFKKVKTMQRKPCSGFKISDMSVFRG